MTIKLYWKYPYQKEFQATITDITDEGVVLDQTLFYPKSGGQENDRGILTIGELSVRIDKVEKINEDIIHFVKPKFREKLKIGDIVKGKIDWKYRYGLMRAHTSQHLFSAIILRDFDIDTGKVSLKFEDVSLTLDREITKDQLKLALEQTNKIANRDEKAIRDQILPLKEIEGIKDKIRSDIPHLSDSESMRLMNIEEVDLVCCGGTHLKKTTEIGPLLLYEFKNGRKIKYFVGNKAVQLLSGLNADIIEISDILKTPLTNLNSAVKKRTKIIDSQQQQIEELSTYFLELLSKRPTLKLDSHYFYSVNFDLEKKIVNSAFSNYPENSVLILRRQPKLVKFLSNSDTFEANLAVEFLLDKYGGKGGGSPQTAQALLDQEPKNILDDIKTLYNKK